MAHGIDIKALEDDFWDKFAKMNPQMQEFFRRVEMGNKTDPDLDIFLEVYGEGDGNLKTRERIMYRTKASTSYRTCLRALKKLESADTMKDKALVRDWAIATIKNTSRHVLKIDPRTKKPRMRTDAEMTEDALLGSEYEVSTRGGIKRKSGNKAAAAKWLSDNYGWNSAVEVNIHDSDRDDDTITYLFNGMGCDDDCDK